MEEKDIKRINNELKGYINEASFISDKCRNQLIKILSKHFYVELPIENYLRVDITIKDNGNIIMKDDEYKTSKPLENDKELLERYNNFKEEILILLEKKEVNFDSKRNNNEILNLLTTLLITILILIICIYAIKQLLYGNIFGVIWFILIVGYYLSPQFGDRLKERYKRCYKYIKKILKK